MTMAWGGGEAKIGSSELRSWPDSRGGVWSAISPSFTPLKSYSYNTETDIDLHTRSIKQICINLYGFEIKPRKDVLKILAKICIGCRFFSVG